MSTMNLGVEGNGAENKVPLKSKCSEYILHVSWNLKCGLYLLWTGASQSQILAIQNTDLGTLDNLNFLKSTQFPRALGISLWRFIRTKLFQDIKIKFGRVIQNIFAHLKWSTNYQSLQSHFVCPQLSKVFLIAFQKV